jgi:hypothetical protein
LWALQVGNGKAGGDTNTVYFTAGLDHETHGLFGSLTPVARGTPEGPAEQQTVIAFLDEFQLAFQTLKTDLSNRASKAQLQQDQQAVDTALRDLQRAERKFVLDERADQGGHQSSALFPGTSQGHSTGDSSMDADPIALALASMFDHTNGTHHNRM